MNLEKTYEPSSFEEKIYQLWEKSGAFSPKHRGSDQYYSVVMPPPNANTNLHIGYELTAALEDITVRYHRMKGKSTLLLPGADHAGFETQSVYEKHLAEKGQSRFDFDREELYQQIWNFVAKNRSSFEKQIRAMGVSADWDRYTFTLDKKIISQAYDTFKKMWDEGLIYRGERLVNYCTFHGTGFADIEVAYKEVKGHIWHIKYILTDGTGSITIATTRPETLLGDVAVAVHPSDKRYTKYVGKTLKLPLTEREIPIIADKFVDKKFGTGAVKITPAHDPNDFEVGERHDLPKISVIGHDGLITHDAPKKYQGMSVLAARKQVVEDLKEQGHLVEVKNHTHNVGHCYKCSTVIEPLLLEQWFIDMQPLANKALQALNDGQIRFYPQNKQEQLVRYLKGLRDWNISRQIAWGIPIPAFVNEQNPDDWIFDTRVDQTVIEVDNKTYRRDPDVFDTWFSSSSWPYATLGGVNGDDFNQFYPTSLMETGGEILYPWVSRMIMMGLYVTGKAPFKEVYIHGYVMAEDGSKMSKSTGNVVDPMPVIKKYGSDALRMGIISGRSPAVNSGYDSRRVEEARNFCNKLWNVARFVQVQIASGEQSKTTRSVADEWILDRLNKGSTNIGKYLESYRFSEAYEMLYHLVWDDVADWYIEASKVNNNHEVLNQVLETILKISHPFAPFLSETIWQSLFHDKGLLITSSWPSTTKVNPTGVRQFNAIKEIVSEIRQLKTAVGIKKGTLQIQDSTLVKNNRRLLCQLANLADISFVLRGKGIALSTLDGHGWLEVDEKTANQAKHRLFEQLVDTKAQIATLQTRLANKNYLNKAPQKLVAESKEQLKSLQEKKELIGSQLLLLDKR